MKSNKEIYKFVKSFSQADWDNLYKLVHRTSEADFVSFMDGPDAAEEAGAKHLTLNKADIGELRAGYAESSGKSTTDDGVKKECKKNL